VLKPLHNKLLPFQDIHLDEWTSAEKEGGWGPGVDECEVEFEWGTVEKDQGYVRERSRNMSFSLRRSGRKRNM
jgi:hypothetical protein